MHPWTRGVQVERGGARRLRGVGAAAEGGSREWVEGGGVSGYTQPPDGFCACGCGGKTSIAKRSWHKSGAVRGKPQRFIRYHNRRRFRLDQIFTYGVRTDSGCLLWPYAEDGHGYGRIRVGNSTERVSRIVVQLSLGRPLQDGECALHRCDTPRCYEPSHLFVGTKSDNLRDAYAKGRRRRAPELERAGAIRRTDDGGELRLWPA